MHTVSRLVLPVSCGMFSWRLLIERITGDARSTYCMPHTTPCPLNMSQTANFPQKTIWHIWYIITLSFPSLNPTFLGDSVCFVSFTYACLSLSISERRVERKLFSFSTAIHSAITGNMQLTGKAFSQ